MADTPPQQTPTQPTQKPQQGRGFAGILLKLFGIAPEQVASLEKHVQDMKTEIQNLEKQKATLLADIEKNTKEFEEQKKRNEFQAGKILEDARDEAERIKKSAEFEAQQKKQYADTQAKIASGEELPQAERTVKT